MSALGLGGYSSSEDEDQSPPRQVARNGDKQIVVDQKGHDRSADEAPSEPLTTTNQANPDEASATQTRESSVAESNPILGPAPGPLPGPAPQSIDTPPPYPEDSPALANGSLSPYTENRQLLRDLTLPTIPKLDIPDSPPGSPPRASTAKFNKFLELKKQGVHFNQRLAESSALRNPALMQKLMTFAGIIDDDDQSGQYENSLPAEMSFNKAKIPAWQYADNMIKAHREIETRRERAKLGKQRDFVPARTETGGLPEASSNAP